MFVSKRVRGLFKKGALKLVNDSAGDTHRMAEATWVLEPFGADLARELGDEVYNHLFDENGGIRSELEKVELRIGVGMQRVVVRSHGDLEPVATLNDVEVKDVKVERVEDLKADKVWLRLSVALVFELVGAEARSFVIDQFGNVILLDFKAIQHRLPIDEGRRQRSVGDSPSVN